MIAFRKFDAPVDYGIHCVVGKKCIYSLPLFARDYHLGFGWELLHHEGVTIRGFYLEGRS